LQELADSSGDGSRWISSAQDYLLPVPVLSQMFRGKMLAPLKAAHGQDRLQFFGPYTELADKAAFKTFLEPLYHTHWHVYAKSPFAGPQQVLAYLARYTHRVADCLTAPPSYAS
jgi:Putative transposase